jgi:hypothetical protein
MSFVTSESSSRERTMHKPIKFVCPNCSHPILELNEEPHKMLGALGSYCSSCSQLITRNDILLQVQYYCLLSRINIFHKNKLSDYSLC